MKLFPESWNIEEANKVCSHIIDCINKTAPIVDFETPYKMIRTTNVKNGRINLDDARSVDEATFIKWNRRLTPQFNDIVLTREAPLGDVGLIRGTEKVFLGQRTMLYRANPKILDQHFLYYTLLGPTLQAQLKTLGSGSTVEHVRVPDAEKLLIPYPNLKTQKKIAAILSAYDDLIENNKRRIVLLEKMAEEIYREWFVRFRFPGYQTAEFEKGIPKGWKETKLKDIVDLKSGFAFKSEKYEEGSRYGIVTIKNVHDGKFIKECSDHIAEPPERLPKHCFIKSGDILMSLTGNVGRVCITHGQDLLLNQRVVLLKPKTTSHSHYIYWLFRQKTMLTFCELISTGTAQQNLSPIKLSEQKITYPINDLVEEYQVHVNPLMNNIATLLQQNDLLEKTKRALLPRLISGKLSVEDLDIQFPPSMQEDVRHE